MNLSFIAPLYAVYKIFQNQDSSISLSRRILIGKHYNPPLFPMVRSKGRD